ncbi:hypothetical protein ACNJY2_09555, partial [Aeromonas veronii]
MFQIIGHSLLTRLFNLGFADRDNRSRTLNINTGDTGASDFDFLQFFDVLPFFGRYGWGRRKARQGERNRSRDSALPKHRLYPSWLFIVCFLIPPSLERCVRLI